MSTNALRSPARFKRLQQYAPALVAFVAVLVLWEGAVVVFNIKGFLLPKPSVIAATLVEEWSVVFAAGLFTMREALGGFALGCGLGLGVALLTARWATLREGLLPLAVAVNATPIVALAPIMHQWFGITSPLAKMSIVALITFFPVMINTMRGLTQVSPAALELLRSYAADEITILRQVRWPTALPFVFSALKVSSTLSVIAAIVSEYFGGYRGALGAYITQQAALFHFAEAWAAIIVACGLGLAFYFTLLLLERWLMPWAVALHTNEAD